MQLKKTFFTALLLFIAGIVSWEYYCLEQGYIAALNDDLAIWAVQRSKLENMSQQDVVILGSSRAHFDIQLDQWEAKTGIRPVMLACDGSTPTPIFQDIVNNTDFNGTIVIGVTPGLFFSAPVEQVPMWKRPKIRVDYYYERTWAQRINHLISVPLENTFAFLNSSEEEWADDIDLKSMIKRMYNDDRLNESMPPFYNFSYIDIDRNTTMLDKTVYDTAFAATIQKVWMYFGKNAPPPVKEPIINIYKDMIAKYNSRGGNVIFLRLPSGGGFRQGENMGLPRDQFWEQLLAETNTPGYHFEDYKVLNQYDPPEWSHLATPDAKIFTTDLVSILLNDKAIPNLQ